MSEQLILAVQEGESQQKDLTQEFELVEKLGSGSYGVVWRAIHQKTKTVSAIKIVPVENDLEDLFHEISMMKACKSPYIINYFGSYFRPGENELWIVMEMCGAGSVSDLMKVTDKTLTEEQIAVVLRDALKGLAYLHDLRKIHRDIKAGNILLNNKGQGKLADFGVSGQLSDTMAKRNTVIGTPFWMAPEVIQEIGYDVKADIWSLGITGIEMADGKPPHANIHPMRVIFMIPSKPPPKLAEPDKWSKDFNDFLSLCLMKNPDQRPTANELLQSTFLVNAKASSTMLPMIEEAEEIIQKIGRGEALGLESESGSEEEDGGETRSARPMAEDNGTMNTNTCHSFSTMIITDDNADSDAGTVKVTGNDEFVPQFMSFLDKDKKEEAALTTSTPPIPNTKYAEMTTQELKERLAHVMDTADEEVDRIRNKYEKQKRDIDAALKMRAKK
ncbi:hypothetical protein PROFUN_08107 [Planoprotostelium fungivorum]|uniref:non-specific serine/threonine protein kinase n=1 Tax=Planoprotostelium fungivorum TaxID=1890364 RepID=A0A2P6NKD8_9EUKA|nr:hypothetical protein PROFUN_08107 [Planoprotostelium fungivorum]